jgi:type VI secretion system protein ImpI
MTLTLQIENETRLPDGGPLSISIKGKRGLDIGRDPYLDWTLPDPSRFISGRHCEVRWHDGGYWLHDISTNGTFLNNDDSRLRAPHRLRSGDRLTIGHYVIVATVEDEAIDRDQPASPVVSSNADLWASAPDAAPPVSPRALRAAGDLSPARPDFLDWAVSVPQPALEAITPAMSDASAWDTPAAIPHSEDDSWASGPLPQTASPPEVIPIPMPRRPLRTDSEAAAVQEIPTAPQPNTPDSAAVVQMPARHAGGDAAASHRADTDRSAARFPQIVARGAGLPADTFAGRDPDELAEQLGELLKLVTDCMKQLLEARQQAKRLARSPNQTTIEAFDNNPLKFAPTADDALRTMFGLQSRSYLDAKGSFAQGFADLKAHQIRTYAAMQQAVRLLVKDLDPTAIEAASDTDHGLSALIGSRKARLWDIYVAKWQATAQRHENGLLDTFMDYFARCYDTE